MIMEVKKFKKVLVANRGERSEDCDSCISGIE